MTAMQKKAPQLSVAIDWKRPFHSIIDANAQAAALQEVAALGSEAIRQRRRGGGGNRSESTHFRQCEEAR